MKVCLSAGGASEDALAAALEALGAEVEETSFGVAGAVEESELRARFEGGEVTILISSYEGPVIKGPAAAVNALVAEVGRQRAPR